MKNSSSVSIPIVKVTSKGKNNIAIASTKATIATVEADLKSHSAPKAKAKSKAAHKKPVVKNTEIATPYNLSKSAPLGIKRNPLGHLLIEKMFRESGFRGGISSDKRVLGKYSTDESIFSIRPQVVIQPKNRSDVEIAAKVIARETKRFTSLSLTPRAAGTGLSGGSLTDSIVVDVCAHLNRIGEVIEKKDKITFNCEPGAMWRDVEKKLKRHQAYLPPYTSSKDICSIGGSIGNNAAGPDSLRYGHCADWVESLDVVLADGNTYTIKPLSNKEFKTLVKQRHEYARIAREIYDLVEKNESEILRSKPKTQKNTAGYSLWHVVPEGVAAFKKGKGVFDLTRLISGSQGTIGIITNIVMRALPIQKNTTLLVVPIFNLEEAAKVVLKALDFNPINVEIFDGLTYDLALKNPDFFKKRLSGLDYYRTMLNMYATYHIRYGRKTPEFTILITLDEETVTEHGKASIVKAISTLKTRARVVSSQIEAEMLWQIRRASFTLSKFQDPKRRPAAFLEDMTVPPENLSKFFIEVKRLFKEFNVTAAVHGHGANGHFHFYPLLDFTNKTTPMLVERMAEKFYSTAIKYKGNICGEHNDGIIRTPHLSKMFSKHMLELFKQTEHIFDPDDIFNPGKKVNPRFDIKATMRTTN
ncbi:MAG TPA: FAD-binding oxidoreductase [Candidatus Paceibacterota bacterium]|nr:FAD-binding oxidoreductase [Candidatus Paceibacterota bacterium]